MPQKYAGRVILILAVLFVGLFGVPPLADGIFSISKLFSSAPFSEKLNLKPGIDIAGGTRLIYRIEEPPGGWRGEKSLAEQVVSILQRRVDPTGTKNLVWQAIGHDQIKIELPRSSTRQEQVAKVKQEYRTLTDQLDQFNIGASQVIDAVERLTGEQRTTALARLEKNSPARKQLFAELVKLYDSTKQLKAEVETLKKATPRDEARLLEKSEKLAEADLEYNKAKGRIDTTNLAVSDVEMRLENPSELNKKDLAAYKVNYSERKALLEKLEALYPAYQKVRDSIDDAAALRQQLKGSGVLEFHIMVNNPQAEQPDMLTRLQNEGPVVKAGDQSRWFEVARPKEFGLPSFTNPRDGKTYALAWVTPDKSMVHQEGGGDWVLQRAYPTPSERGDLIVGFEFDVMGGKLFGTLTGNNIGQQLATVLDNKIITAPSIRSRIDRSGTIDGGSKGYTEAERTYLVNTLNAGALPAQLNDEPKVKDVAPLLGESNLRAGLISCLIALAVVGAFMIFYYRLSGVVATVALLFNMITIIGIMAMMGATFTLPGIAGLVLTIGVSVDANVLIFERLREEEGRGLSLKLALRNAYDRAFSAILDSNITTAITSVFLAYFGSAEVRGFGLTLLIGIITSMFAALFVTKTLFAVLIDRFGVRKLGSFPMSHPGWERLLHPRINWMKLIPGFLTFSAIIIVSGTFAFVQKYREGKLLDVEFTPGTELTFKVNTPMTDGDIRALLDLKAKEVPQPTIVAVGSEEENARGKYREFSVMTSNPARREVEEAVLVALKGKLDMVVGSRFEMFSAKPADNFDTARAAEILRPVVLKENRFIVDGMDVPEAGRHVDGVAVVLKNLEPPLRPAETANRIRGMLEENRQLGSLKVDVFRLDNVADASAPTSKAVAMISTSTFPFSKQEADWREKVAMPFWKAVNAGIGRDANFSEVNNTDALVAGDAQRAALFATLFSLVFIMIWIWVRFGDHTYGTATVLAMLHDTWLVVGMVGISHWLAGTFIGDMLGVEAFRVNMTLIAGILTVMGYSMVDTIVVFDRIRENRGKYGVLSPALINDSVNQTLSRTLLTAGVTSLTVLVMYIWGGSAIHGFTFVMLVGILIGTYSSIAIAAPILLLGHKHLAPQKGGKTVPTAAVQKA